MKLENELTCQVLNEVVKSGMWVIAIYEGEKLLGRLLEKKGSQVRVQCLERLFGVTGPQKLEVITR